MELSRRARAVKASTTLAVTARVGEMKAAGIDVIGFGAGQPDFDTPENIKQAAIDALRGGATKYTPTPGTPEARSAIADKLRTENGIACETSDVIITTGAKQALYLALQSVVDPGREVILLTPAWVSYRPMAELAGATVVEVPGRLENDFKVTPDQLESALTDKTAAVMINSPSNPCGTMYSESELRGLGDVLERHPQVAIVADEIYEKIIFGGIEHASMGSFQNIASRVITINGLSKAYAMTGWRIGYLCAPGDGGAVAKAAARIQSQMTSNITSFCYAAILEALAHGAEAVETMRQSFAERAVIMHDLVTAMPDLPCPKPTGAFYLFPDIGGHLGTTSPEGRSIDTALAFAEALLEEARVAVVPGEDFGTCGRTHVRVSFACSIDAIRAGCARLDGWLRSLTRAPAEAVT